MTEHHHHPHHDHQPSPPPDPALAPQVTDALARQRGPRFWRSLDEWSGTPEFRTWLGNEFPSRLADWDDYDGVTRRSFLKVMAASFTLALLPSCTDQTHEKIVPYVQDPDASLVPGKPQFFATTLTRGYEAAGVLAESHQGRPTKIEGNPDHPASLGSTDLFTQAMVLGLCDPDRSQAVVGPDNTASDWESFTTALRQRLSGFHDGRQGQSSPAGLAILSGTMTSPTQLAELQTVLQRYPDARWFSYDPVGRGHARTGASIVVGRPLDAVYDFSQASTILSLDADFLFGLPGSVRYARDFTDARRVRKAHPQKRTANDPAKMNRLYVVEPSPSLTGAKADHRLPATSDKVASVAIFIARALGVGGDLSSWKATDLSPEEQHWASICSEDLQTAGPGALVICGESQPPAIHALVHMINASLGSMGKTVYFIDPVDQLPDHRPATLPELAVDIQQGHVQTLIILDANPVYDARGDLSFGKLLKQVPFTAHLGLYHDETAAMCQWHVPMNHPLESWGDARAYDGTASVIQPLIDPLYHGHSVGELLTRMVSDDLYIHRNAIRSHWQQTLQSNGGAKTDFESWWRNALRVGVIPDSRSQPQPVRIATAFTPQQLADFSRSQPSSSLSLLLRPSSTIWDGRYANNAWLQEIPDPLTKLTWGHALLMSASTAREHKIVQAGGVELTTDDQQSLTATAYIMPGQADGELTLSLGYGRTGVGQVGNQVGLNGFALRNSDSLRVGVKSIKPVDAPYELATTQNHQLMEGRDLYRSGTLAAFNRDGHNLGRVGAKDDTADQPRTVPLSLMPEDPNAPSKPNAQQQWGMSIDLTSCIGCNACTVACQAENAIPVVGKDQVIKGREMHWIRLDRYFAGDPAVASEAEFHHQPVPCMHCEEAPCEIVCPVGATQHSEDGLNEMVYNRCIGTRYCSNNCPYKVRRFNFFNYSQEYENTYALQKNPDVTVRARGVMEKCSYCVQRIRRAQIDTHEQNHTLIPDGDIQTACQQVCPTHAIVFGDVADKTTHVSREKAQPHNYGMLEELNTKPRTTYLADVRNPNPKLLQKT